jgi:glycosyltransferase involved in cell wall biosynthesis
MTLNKIVEFKDALVNLIDKKNRLAFVVETNNWIVKWVGEHVVGYLKQKGLINGRVSLSSFGLKNKIIHFGSVNAFAHSGLKKHDPSNKIVFSWFHVVPDDKRLKFIPEINERVDMVLTSCQATKNELIKNGLREDKIVVVALGVDLKYFKAYSAEKKAEIKKKLGLADGKIIIGSFQKDGNGWGEGLEPKLIKGPDVFCDAVIKLAQKYPIQVLLTGPARGYVKKRLSEARVPYVHNILKKQKEMVDYYNCLDLYIIASRVEGGPESLAESWACGVPLVSTKMGMPADVIVDGANGMLAEVEDVDGLVMASEKILSDKIFRDKLAARALEDVKNLGWDKLAVEYFDKVYKKIL